MSSKEQPGVEMWTIYKNPTDVEPLKGGENTYVLRRWVVYGGSDIRPDEFPMAVQPTLDECRKFLPWGSVNLGRMELDDPAILETWI